MKEKKTLRELRKLKGLYIEDVAKATGISRNAISSYELGKYLPYIETRKILADFYGVSIDDIEWEVKYKPKYKRNDLSKKTRESKPEQEEPIQDKESTQEELPSLIPNSDSENANSEMELLIYETAIDLLDDVCKKILSLPTKRAKLMRLADLDNCFHQFNLDTDNMRKRLEEKK